MTTFRIDDVGASTKYFNQHGKKVFRFKGFPVFYFPLANFWFLKRIWPFKNWAPYEELTAEEWKSFLDIFKKNNIKPLVAITACWVDEKNNLVPFPEKFPKQAEILREAFWRDEIIIANHGLTHCIIGKHLPKFWSDNRASHREFWPYLSQNTHNEHIQKSQKILEDYFEKPIEIFVPPGSVWSIKTYRALQKTNLKKIISGRYMLNSEEIMKNIEFVDDKKGFLNFHDRELKLSGKKWLLEKINYYKLKK